MKATRTVNMKVQRLKGAFIRWRCKTYKWENRLTVHLQKWSCLLKFLNEKYFYLIKNILKLSQYRFIY